MKKVIIIIFNVIIVALAMLELFFLYKWIVGVGTYAPLFTFVNGLLIPATVYIRKHYEGNTANIENNNSVNESELLLIIDSAKVIYTGNTGEYNMQINIRISAKNKDIFISDARISCGESVIGCGGIYGDSGLKLIRFYRKTEADLLLLDDNNLKSFLIEEKKYSSLTDMLQIQRDNWYFYTIIDFINSERLSDGYEDFSTDKWKLIFEYNDRKKVEFDFRFEIHNTSVKYPVKWRYSGFN